MNKYFSLIISGITAIILLRMIASFYSPYTLKRFEKVIGYVKTHGEQIGAKTAGLK